MGSNLLAVLAAVLLVAARAEDYLKLCILENERTSCLALERQSPIKCEFVKNTVECAIKLVEGRADFGAFTADQVLLAHHFYPKNLNVVAEMKDKFHVSEQFEYQSVAVVHKNYTESNNNFNSLYGGGFCHPGFSKSESWHDRALKYFEKKVVPNACRRIGIENEIGNIKDFFRKGCRPGDWVPDKTLDSELKKKYPEMCELCDNPSKCKYSNLMNHGHIGALECLTSGKGSVAYVSHQIAKSYFERNPLKKMSDYRFLCENGSVMPIDSVDPCAWYKQPWDVILARGPKAAEVAEKLEEATSNPSLSNSDWKDNLRAILFRNVAVNVYKNNTTPGYYLNRTRNMEMPKPDTECGGLVRWCTVSDKEQTKCNWTSAVALGLGITPSIACVPAQSPFECFHKIANHEADIISIDSNYGHLARKVYKLLPIMYGDTQEKLNSVVVAAVRDKAHLKRIKNWSDVKSSSACFPEYGGIAWLSFINTARDHRVLSNSCKYAQIVANLLSGACTPGFVEASHSMDRVKPRMSENNFGKLCELCPKQSNGEQCEANSFNSFYGDKGALDCLKQGVGDIAFLEAGNIKAFIENNTINSSDYRVLCKNGSLAEYTGFDVDANCALSVTIDSEVVSRRTTDDPHLVFTKLLLLKLEEWLGFRASEARHTLHIYGSFNGTENLLFKDSIVGLVPLESEIRAVMAYKELFNHVDKCTSGALSNFAVVTLVIVNFLFARFI